MYYWLLAEKSFRDASKTSRVAVAPLEVTSVCDGHSEAKPKVFCW